MKRCIFTLLSVLACAVMTTQAQELKVIQSDDMRKINRDVQGGISTVVFETSIKNLIIDNQDNDEHISMPGGIQLFLIQPESNEYVENLGYPKRSYILKATNLPEYLLNIEEIQPNTVLYYTVILANRYPMNFSAEYILSKSSKHGFRLSFGRKFGGYISYKFGDYIKSGINIDNVTQDTDFSKAKLLGTIRQAIYGGFRMGIYTSSHQQLYILTGGGYSEYGRQWENPLNVQSHKYFYTDYLQGVGVNLGVQCIFADWLCLSAGSDITLARGKASIDYALGLGVNLNSTKNKKYKKN